MEPLNREKIIFIFFHKMLKYKAKKIRDLKKKSQHAVFMDGTIGLRKESDPCRPT
jgi:hypothetical protein